MFNLLARLAVRRGRLVLVCAVVVTVLFGALGAGVVSKLSSGGFDDPDSESSIAQEKLQEHFGSVDPNLVLLVRSPDRVDSAQTQAAGAQLAQRLEKERGVENVVSYWTAGKPSALRSKDGRSALVMARIDGDPDAASKRLEQLRPAYSGEVAGLDVKVGGDVAIAHDTDSTVESDLRRAEAVAFPLLFLLLVLVFGSLIAAFLPLLVTVPVVLGTLCFLRALAAITDVSVFALNIATIIGLGLAVDYSLLLLARYREELRRRGADITDPGQRGEAVAAAVRTAGRTVVFSAVTVALSLSALLLFPMVFLRSLAYAGIAVPLLAAAASLVVVPSLLAVLGPRIDRLDLRAGVRRVLKRPERPTRPEEQGLWYRLAMSVMRYAIPVSIAVVGLLVSLGLPFLRGEFSPPDDRVMPTTAESRQVGDALREEFSSRESDALSVVATVTGKADAGGGAAERAAQDREVLIADYAERLSALDGVTSVTPHNGDRGVWFKVVPSVEPASDEGTALVADIREMDAPWPVQVTGPSALRVDTNEGIASRLPLALTFVGLATFVLLFLFTGSVLLPLKAIVLNLLSMTATFGTMVWIFQDGHLSGLLGNFTATGTLVTPAPVLMFCAAFGLSMDYEVFMLSRIKEEYDGTGDTRRAVAVGLARVGRLITAAAALLAVVCLALTTSDIAFAKMIGLGLALAIIVDATVVRGLLVPAFMRIAGQANWWAPAPLRRLHQRIGLREEGREPDPEQPSAGTQPSDLVSTGGEAR